MNNISMHILDIVQNSISGEASLIEIIINENLLKNILEIKIQDNGKGMDHEMLKQVEDPYTTTRTTRKVGMGIPLLKHSAEQSNGYLKVNSELGVGTLVQAAFKHDHIDRPPLGDIAGTIVLLVAANPEIDFKYIHSFNDKKYEFNTQEVKEILGDIKISDPKIRGFLKEMITENLNDIYFL
ncbi:MAG: ATP-binding protein [Bacteroidales bacterium]|nr:ATP-binding protein [Bacteroidales bacterium]